MCGIAGIFNTSSLPVKKEDIRKMTDALTHRGPESDGFWVDGTVGLGHRRLAIIDLSEKGRQPMHYMGKNVITYNGEIYNYIELRHFLIKKGYNFNSDTDTEVILASYDYWGTNCLLHFDGMFAFAIYNRQSEELFCARDRFGEKPFHYYFDNERFMFASEMKSLWAVGADKSIDDYFVYLYLNMGLHENPNDRKRTFFKTVFRLMPGHYFIYRKGQKINQIKYWSINSPMRESDISFQEACDKFKELFFKSVSFRLRSDVPLGTSLSGGLDSSAVALVMYSLNKDAASQICFSARFNDKDLDEGYYMQKVVENKNIEHHETYPNEQNLMSEMKTIMYHQEEPFASASIFAQWEVFKLAKQKGVTVLLDGQGSDEILAGYSHFFKSFFREKYLYSGKKALHKAIDGYQRNNIVTNPIHVDMKFLAEARCPETQQILRNIKRRTIGVSATPEIHKDLHGAYKHIKAPFAIFTSLNPELNYFTTVSGLEKLLRFADRNSMAHSLEVRLPFLSHELVEFLFTLPSDYKIYEGWTKALIRYSLSDMLPKEVAWRKIKLGFQPPQEQWFKRDGFFDFAKCLQDVAITEKYISPKANVGWNGLVIGAFVNMTKNG